MGLNSGETRFFNEYATHMIPIEDQAMATVKKLQKAVFELQMMDKNALKGGTFRQVMQEREKLRERREAEKTNEIIH